MSGLEFFAILPVAIAQAPKVLLPALQRCENVQADLIIAVLKTQMNKMKDDINKLLTADLKTARQQYVIGLQEVTQYLRANRERGNGPSDPRYEEMWKETMKSAYEAAQSAYNKVPDVKDKIECFMIMYTCAVMINPPVSACIKIRTWIEELCSDATILKALKEFRNCLHGNRRGKKLSMSSTTKEILAAFFKQLKGAVVAIFYLSDIDENCKIEKGQIVQLLRQSKNLSKATESLDNLENMKISDGVTAFKVVYYATIVLPLIETMAKTAKKSIQSSEKETSNNDRSRSRDHIDDPAKEVIIETGHLIHLICHSGDDPNLREFAPTWLERIHVPAQPLSKRQQWKKQVLEAFLKRMEVIKAIEISTIVKNTKNHLFITVTEQIQRIRSMHARQLMQDKKEQIVNVYHEQKQIIKTIPFSNMSIATKAQKLYVSMLASFSCFGFFSLYVYSTMNIGRSRYSIFSGSLPDMNMVRHLSRKILASKETQKIVSKAVSVVAKDIENGGVLLVG